MKEFFLGILVALVGVAFCIAQEVAILSMCTSAEKQGASIVWRWIWEKGWRR
jgi:hypothetical protein